MCHVSCILFGVNQLTEFDISGKSVLDVGSRDYNGNFAPLIKRLNPAKYVGVDMLEGPGVDIVCRAENLVEKFGKEFFDVVIASELMEHTSNWREVISNLKNVCKPDGLVVITTRSEGFRIHGYPHDYWRYELKDIEDIFSDCQILTLERDPEAPGVFLKARKPKNFSENSLDKISLYSILEKKRILTIDENLQKRFWYRYGIYQKILRFVRKFEKMIINFLKNVSFSRHPR